MTFSYYNAEVDDFTPRTPGEHQKKTTQAKARA